MCIDQRALNKIIIKNRYPLSCINDLMDQLQGVMYFSKMDLRSGYHQVRIKEEDIQKTAFKNKQGLFEVLVLPFGLSNASTTFVQVMNEVIVPFLDSFVIMYLDDILIFNNSQNEHVEYLRQVLQTLK